MVRKMGLSTRSGAVEPIDRAGGVRPCRHRTCSRRRMGVLIYDPSMESTDIVRVLRDSLTDEGVRQWLQTSNTLLDGALPADLLVAGHHDRVLEAACAFVEGTYL